MSEPKYKRIVLKLSGEALMGKAKYGIDEDHLLDIAKEIAEAHRTGTQIGIVLGAGNIFRGVKGASKGMDRASADYMGMLATVMNALAMQHALENVGCPTRVMSALPMQAIAEPFIRQRAIHHLDQHYVVIFSAGTGLPFFTTDTAAALRAAEIGAQVLMKATKVEGVYDKDPAVHDDAKLYEELSYADMMAKNLRVMDLTAVSLCRDNSIPILVYNMLRPGNILKAVKGEAVGTIIKE
ncbi:MAG: UMP kinase [Candidatus Lernaella stagnicola]|nr:UMP kinase [Candidatus Lernaella stagnicola]